MSYPRHYKQLLEGVIAYKFFFIIIIIIRVFHVSVNWWSFTGDWVTASHLMSQGLFLSILAVFNNTVVWMVSTRPPTSKSSRPFNNPLVTVPKAPITIGIIVTFIFHSCFNSLARSRYLSLFSQSFSFILWSAGTAKSTILHFFVVDYYKVWFSGRIWRKVNFLAEFNRFEFRVFLLLD